MTKQKKQSQACQAYETYLRESGIPYVAVDEAKKALFAGVDLASFDFVVYSDCSPNLLVTCRPFAEGKTRATMEEWQRVFGSGFVSAEVRLVDGYPIYTLLDGTRLALPPQTPLGPGPHADATKAAAAAEPKTLFDMEPANGR